MDRSGATGGSDPPHGDPVPRRVEAAASSVRQASPYPARGASAAMNRRGKRERKKTPVMESPYPSRPADVPHVQNLDPVLDQRALSAGAGTGPAEGGKGAV